jgi:hypothetical protein
MDSNDLRLADIQDWLPGSEASFVAHYSRDGLRLLAKAGKVRAIQLPNGEWLYDPDDLLRLKRPRRRGCDR